jgi:hypothetical protein
VSHSATT